MRHVFIAFSLLITSLVQGCASEPETRPSISEDDDRPAKRRGGPWRKGRVEANDDAMGMEMSIGVLDERAVDRAIKPHERSLIRCFERAGDARKYLSGQVVMRFMVASTGQVTDVQVIRNGLGSYPVESCMVTIGKKIRFPAPEGRRGTDFEYSLSFRSTGERTVLPYNGDEMARYLFGISPSLANCGTISGSDVSVVAYVEPGGSVGSVGFASEGSLDPEATVCVADLMRKVHVTDGPSASSSIVLRATFPMAMAFERPLGGGGDSSRRLSKRIKHR
jgi:hypothetical protein